MAEEKKVPNLKAKYQQEVAPALMQKFGYKSTMQIPKLDKIVVNCGCGEARDNSKVLADGKKVCVCKKCGAEI